ncbi:hypothetical protein F7725_004401 [Dissostichus mawsoni]|uniref:Uncharacterized protein n=1 Tax=Dissostichus mawsoni TaxID=36200 RepID=A0A7J5XJZ2_DISMA|nr:hypothetical protein F7725_004401 [Dissostichus mawsoni]
MLKPSVGEMTLTDCFSITLHQDFRMVVFLALSRLLHAPDGEERSTDCLLQRSEFLKMLLARTTHMGKNDPQTACCKGVTPSDSIVSVGISTDAGLLQMPLGTCCSLLNNKGVCPAVMQSDSWISTDAGLLQMSLWNMLLTAQQQRCLPRLQLDLLLTASGLRNRLS